jgi:hypothetical protein
MPGSAGITRSKCSIVAEGRAVWIDVAWLVVVEGEACPDLGKPLGSQRSATATVDDHVRGNQPAGRTQADHPRHRALVGGHQPVDALGSDLGSGLTADYAAYDSLQHRPAGHQRGVILETLPEVESRLVDPVRQHGIDDIRNLLAENAADSARNTWPCWPCGTPGLGQRKKSSSAVPWRISVGIDRTTWWPCRANISAVI